MEPSGMLRKLGLFSANILARVQDAQVPLSVLNLTDQEIIIPKGCIVGMLSVSDCAYQVYKLSGDALDKPQWPWKQVQTQKTVSSCSEASQRTTPIEPAEPDSLEFDLGQADLTEDEKQQLLAILH